MPFKGKPIVSYSIEEALKSNIADTVMVSTDDEEIADVARCYGAEVPFFRSKENANDSSGLAEVVIEVLDQYKKKGMTFDYTVLILATAPLIQANSLREAYKQLLSNPTAESICSVASFSYPPQRGLVIRDGNLVMLHPENYTARSQDLERIYHDCGQFFIFRTNAFVRDKKLYTQNMLPYFVDETESQDIDNETDWKIAEMKYELLTKKDE